jgi:hypothetical protein
MGPISVTCGGVGSHEENFWPASFSEEIVHDEFTAAG